MRAFRHPSGDARYYLLVAWGLSGPALLLTRAVWRLAPLAWEALAAVRSVPAAIGMVLVCALMAWLEGYRGFQRRFVPRVVGRAHEIAQCAPAWKRFLAPIVVLELVGASPRQLLARWGLVLGLFLLVSMAASWPSAVRHLLNVGVFVGLGWGLVALLQRSIVGNRDTAATQPTPEQLLTS